MAVLIQPSEAQRRLFADFLDRRAGALAERWLARLEAEIVTATPPSELKESVRGYLGGITGMLRGGQAIAPGGRALWRSFAAEHALTRVRQGFDVQQLVRELILLGQTIRDTIRDEGASLPGDLDYASLVTEILEEAIAVAVTSYVGARDYAARRAEAEHVGFLAHQLRTPLGAATLAAGQLRRLAGVSEHAARTLDLLERNLAKVSRLIDETLLAERLEAGAVDVRRVETPLAPLLEEALATCRPAAEAKGLAIKTTIDPRMTAYLDPKLTSSALEHLLENSVKYTEAGEVSVSVAEEDRDVVVHIRDTCGGLSSEELALIFEPFRRGRTSKSGSGLGLAIARRAIQAQGGTIDAESPGESGCHFWFRMPKGLH